jgi:predicted amidohydrolase
VAVRMALLYLMSGTRMDVLIRGGRVIDLAQEPNQGICRRQNAALEPDLRPRVHEASANPACTRVIEARGCIVAPDSSTCIHLREPGFGIKK